MEIATKDNVKLVYLVFERTLGNLRRDQKINEKDNYVYQIETLSQEVNSGASFEQYFRWVTKHEVDHILIHLKQLNIPQVYSIVQEAINVAFPDGIPEDEDEYNKCTDWSESQERQLHDLFKQFENYNGAILNRLGKFIIENHV